MRDLKIPDAALDFLHYPTHFDRTNTDAALEGSNIRLPVLREYARTIWDYWENHLNEERLTSENIDKAVADKAILITGAGLRYWSCHSGTTGHYISPSGTG